MTSQSSAHPGRFVAGDSGPPEKRIVIPTANGFARSTKGRKGIGKKEAAALAIGDQRQKCEGLLATSVATPITPCFAPGVVVLSAV